MDDKFYMFIFAYSLGATAGWSLCWLYKDKDIKEWKSYALRLVDISERLGNKIQRMKPIRSNNGRFVSRKQIVTEELRIEQLKKQASQFPEF